MKQIAHRAYAGIHPENTLAAVKESVSGEHHERPDMIEIDIQPCEGDEIIVFHDEKLRKHGELGLTDKKGAPWKTSCAEVRDAEVLDSGEKIPTLREIFEATPDDVAINIEFKDIDSEEVQFQWGTDDIELGIKLSEEELQKRKQIWLDFAEKAMSIADQYENEVLVSSFFEGAIAAVREVSDVPVAFLFWNSIEEGLEVTERHDCEAIHPPIDMIKSAYFNQGVYTDSEFEDIDIVKKAHEQGRDVNVWTINDWHQAHEMRKAGVDGLISNYPDMWYRP